MTAPDRLAKTLIKTLANRGRPHMTKPSADDIGAADRESTSECPACRRLFQAKLETHHEIDPTVRVAGEGGGHRFGQGGIEALFAQNLPDFGARGFRHLFDLHFFALQFGMVMFE